jgi:hypothetical protein
MAHNCLMNRCWRTKFTVSPTLAQTYSTVTRTICRNYASLLKAYHDEGECELRDQEWPLD